VLTGIHILLTLKCTNECDHCFLHWGPSREATFTIGQLRALIRQIEALRTVDIVYFEGGEPFLFYPLLLEGLRMVRGCWLRRRHRQQRVLGDFGRGWPALAASDPRLVHRGFQRQ